MNIKILQVGKTRILAFQEIIEDYLKRTKRFCKISIDEVKECNHPGASIQKKDESDLILKKIKPEDYVILLDETGKKYSSNAFALKITSLQNKNIKDCIFVTGGAYGFSEALYERAQEKMALSDMTFTHQMVRIIFAEQLYRAFTIINKMPYHH